MKLYDALNIKVIVYGSLIDVGFGINGLIVSTAMQLHGCKIKLHDILQREWDLYFLPEATGLS